MKRLTVLLLILAVAFSGCRYEDGPMFSFRTAKSRITNHWKYDIVTKDSFDITYQFKGQSIELKENGDAAWHYVDSTLTGTWKLSDDRKELLVVLSLTNGTLVRNDFEITRLKKDELTLYKFVPFTEFKYYMIPK